MSKFVASRQRVEDKIGFEMQKVNKETKRGLIDLGWWHSQ